MFSTVRTGEGYWLNLDLCFIQRADTVQQHSVVNNDNLMFSTDDCSFPCEETSQMLRAQTVNTSPLSYIAHTLDCTLCLSCGCYCSRHPLYNTWHHAHTRSTHPASGTSLLIFHLQFMSCGTTTKKQPALR